MTPKTARALSLLVLLATITACSTQTALRSAGQRDIQYETATFDNETYSLTHDGTTTAYNVSVLSESSYNDSKPRASLTNKTLTLFVVNAGGHPGVKPSFYTTHLTGTVQAREPPKRLRITDDAGLNNETITLAWTQD